MVSVITIFYNADVQFFEEAIASVAAQTETSWELLLVNDGSTDASASVARRAAAADPERITVLTHPGGANRGMSASRNLGIGAAVGQYICFLDADDLYLPDKLERQLAVLRANPDVGIVFGPSLHWWSWTGNPEDVAEDQPRRLGARPDSVVPAPLLVREYLSRRADTPATCAVLVRRTAILACGGFEPRFRDLYEDQAFFFKLLLRYSAYVEEVAWDRYRRHPSAMCERRIRAGDHRDDYTPTTPRQLFLEWLESYVEESAVGNPELNRLVRRELFPYRHPWLRRIDDAARVSARALLPGRIRRTVRSILGRIQHG